MLKSYIFFSLFIIAFINCLGQILPQPGAKLTYNQIMFECGKVKGATFYLFQITEDKSGASFDHYLLQQKDSSTATLIGNLQFGKKYQWRYAGIKEGQTPEWKGPYHFEIIADSLLDSSLVRMIITQNDTIANAGGLIVNDCTHTIMDRNGKLVWYLDKVDWHILFKKKNLELKPQILDLRLTPFGTITYLADSIPMECDLGGNKLWKAPNDGKVSGSASESYNHDFKRLANGHYLVLGNELWRKLPKYRDTLTIQRKYPVRKVIDGSEFAQVEFGTIIEYDKNGKIVWSWNSQNYFDSDMLKPRIVAPQQDFELKAHINAVSIDSKNQFIYVGFRNISRIVKIEKKTGKVIDSWGLQAPSGGAKNSVLLHQQHDANILDDGTIAVLNSNDYPGSDSFARVVVFSTQPADDGKVVWSFDCDFDSLDRHATRNGGNVDRLKNGNLLVCMGNMNRIFEVTPAKKIVWNSAIKVKGRTGDIYYHRLYRAHYISSLYPCYFTFQTDLDTLKEKDLRFNVKIFNKGSESDSYQVKISSAHGTFSKQFTTATVGSNRSLTLEIKPDKPFAAGDKLIIEISSKTNSDFDRKDVLLVSK
jgi:hypothetical protein